MKKVPCYKILHNFNGIEIKALTILRIHTLISGDTLTGAANSIAIFDGILLE